MVDAQWARQYLVGRVDGYLRGTISLAGVAGAVRLAFKNGLPPDEVDRVLADFDLQWEPSTQMVISRTQSE
jgi:hypothetical protein